MGKNLVRQLLITVCFFLSCGCSKVRFSTSALSSSVVLSGPSNSLMKSTDTITYTATYSATDTIDLLNSDIVFYGNSTGCSATISGSEPETRTIAFTGCSENGPIQFKIARNSDQNPQSGHVQSDVPNQKLIIKRTLIAAKDLPRATDVPEPTTDPLAPPSSALSSPVIVDNTPPVITGLTDDIIPHTAKIWSWGCAEINEPCSYRFVIDTYMTYNFTNEPFDLTATATQSTGTDVYYLHVQAKDAAGNISMVSNVSAVLNNMLPTIAISSPSLALINSSNTIVITATYSNANTISLANTDVIFTGNSLGCVATVSGSSATVRIISISSCSGNGPMQINIAANTAQNIAGAQAAASDLSAVITVDNTPPLLTGLVNDPIPYINKTWTWGCTEVNGPCLYRFLVDTSPTFNFTNETFNSTTTISQATGTNTYYLHIQAKDALGNISSTTHVSALLNNTIPSLTLSSPSSLFMKATDTITYIGNYSDASSISLAISDIVFSGATTGCAASISGSGVVTRTIAVTGCSGDGPMQIRIAAGSAQNSAGTQVGMSSLSSLITVDNTPPVLTGLTNDSLPHTSKTWNWGCTDDHGPCTYRYAIDTNLNYVFSSEVFDSSTSVSQTSGVNTYYLHIQAKDAVGNISAIMNVSTILDNSATSVNLGLSSSSIMKASDVVTYTATYTGAATISLASTDIVFTGIATGCSATVSGSGSTSRIISVTGCSGNGSMQINIAANSAQNSAGVQAGASSLSNVVTVDNLQPTLSGLINDPIPLTSKAWTWGCVDINGPCTYRYVVDTLPTHLFISEPFDSTTTVSQLTGSNTYYLHIQVKDAVGNISEATHFSAILNNTVPTVVLSAPSATLMKSSNTINYTATYSGASTISLANSDIIFTGSSVGCTAVVSGSGTTTRTIAVTGCSGDGSMQINIATNSAKNSANTQVVASTLSSAIIVDNTPPALTGLVNDPTPHLSKTWNWSCTELNGPCTYRFLVDTNATYTYTTEAFGAITTVSQSTGTNTYYLHVQAQDAIGNISTSTDVSTILDNMPLSVSISVPTASTYVTASNINTFTVSGACNKAGGTVVVNAGSTILGTVSCSEGLLWTTSTNFTGFADGNISLTAVLTNTVGTSVTSAAVNIIKDLIAPTMGTVTSDITTNSLTVAPATTWTATDVTSGVSSYEIAIGTTSGGTDTTNGWINIGNVLTYTVGGLSLVNGVNYYTSVRAIDNANNTSAVVTSNSWLVNTAVLTATSGIAKGDYHACALVNGGVKCWGVNSYGQLGNNTTTNSLIPVSVLNLTSGAKEIGSGRQHVCALVNGGVKCWGQNSFGQLGTGSTTDSSTPISVIGLSSGAGGAQSISVGGYHSCALVNGGVKCWGTNSNGQLGNGTTTDSSTPVAVSGLTSGVQSIAAGNSWTCALQNGGIKCWGAGGMLGDGTSTLRTTPVTVSGLASGVQSLVAGSTQTCAIVNGGAKCWGANTYGQLGDGTTNNSLIPVDVSGLTAGAGVQNLAPGNYHTCALVNGGVKCWGYNNYGQLGDGTTTNHLTPMPVTNLTANVQVVAAGGHSTCAILKDGAQCWGTNGLGTLGDGTTTNRLTPVAVSGLNSSGVQSIATGGYHTCNLVNGAAKCWGRNDYMQLGDGTSTSRSSPVAVLSLTAGVQSLAGGNFYSCTLVNGGVKCWGQNTFGKLGDGTTTNRSSPVDAIGLTSGVQGVAAGKEHTCVLKNGGVKCWGYNYDGQLGNNSTTNSSTPVDVVGLTTGVQGIYPGGDGLYTCALLNGGIKCWGNNLNGQLGDGTTTNRSTPVDVSGLVAGAGVQSVVAGGSHACALINGGVKCWGYNGSGQLGDGTQTNHLTPMDVSGLAAGSGVQSISAGLNHVCAIVNGGLKCWGNDYYGQVGDSTTNLFRSLIPVEVTGLTSGVQSINAGARHTCATVNGGLKCWGDNTYGQIGDGTNTERTAPVDIFP